MSTPPGYAPGSSRKEDRPSKSVLLESKNDWLQALLMCLVLAFNTSNERIEWSALRSWDETLDGLQTISSEPDKTRSSMLTIESVGKSTMQDVCNARRMLQDVCKCRSAPPQGSSCRAIWRRTTICMCFPFVVLILIQWSFQSLCKCFKEFSAAPRNFIVPDIITLFWSCTCGQLKFIFQARMLVTLLLVMSATNAPSERSFSALRHTCISRSIYFFMKLLSKHGYRNSIS